MLATAFSSVAQAKKALSSLTPTRFRRKGIEWRKFESKHWFSIYWTQICEEVWAYHAGDFRDFNNFRMTGWQFLADWLEGNALSSSHKSYLLAVKGYLGLPSSKAGTLGHEDCRECLRSNDHPLKIDSYDQRKVCGKKKFQVRFFGDLLGRPLKSKDDPCSSIRAKSRT